MRELTRVMPGSAVLLLLLTTGALAATSSDTGDAPDRYGVASHTLVANAPWLGETPPDANAPVGGEQADGDDRHSTSNPPVDDEDGVFAFPVLVQNTPDFTTNVFVYNPGTTAASLAGWVDFDGNGRFDADEMSGASVPAGVVNYKIKLRWNGLRPGVTSDYTGPSFARFRISNHTLSGADATGALVGGEVEDYPLLIQPDANGDGLPDTLGAIDDGSGTNQPDTAQPEAARPDADADGISDAAEGTIDSDRDGVANRFDVDSDNDGIPDMYEARRPDLPGLSDMDFDRLPDYLDLDSDNDGVFDLYEAGSLELTLPLDVDRDGRVDANQPVGANGYADELESAPDEGDVMIGPVDSDSDGVPDFRDLDSDNDGIGDISETGGNDADLDGVVDSQRDGNRNGLPDSVESGYTGQPDSDRDGIADAADADQAGGGDTDGDNIADPFDPDADGNGVADALVNDIVSGGGARDSDGDGVQDLRDADNGSPDGAGSPDATPSTPADPAVDDADGPTEDDLEDTATGVGAGSQDSTGGSPDVNDSGAPTEPAAGNPDTGSQPTDGATGAPDADGSEAGGADPLQTGVAGAPGCSVSNQQQRWPWVLMAIFWLVRSARRRMPVQVGVLHRFNDRQIRAPAHARVAVRVQ